MKGGAIAVAVCAIESLGCGFVLRDVIDLDWVGAGGVQEADLFEPVEVVGDCGGVGVDSEAVIVRIVGRSCGGRVGDRVGLGWR
jgi:hypothetical protein